MSICLSDKIAAFTDQFLHKTVAFLHKYGIIKEKEGMQ